MEEEEEHWKEEREKAIEEWSEIELRFPDGPQVHQNGLSTNLGTVQRATTAGRHYFHYPDPLIEEILNEDYTQEMVSVTSMINRVQPSPLNTLLNKCLCRPNPHPEDAVLNKERTLLVALSTVPYCNASTTQWSLLQSFYSKVAAVIIDSDSRLSECPRIGSHWQNVGFQGCDPATDFRGTGILGLVQLYSMAINLSENKLREVVHLSRTEPNDFPLAVVGINITALLVTRLRTGDLLESAIICHGYLKAINKLHEACILAFCKQWKDEKCTIKDCQHLLNSMSTTFFNSRHISDTI
ncbi:hypothetical protein KIN20_011643 [Parelaphostrongylus tenuis]|uniref:ELMO domain-containing protein n=1 Tax=Parelaphostrongylus tenuis TaxID=148309 RepID=A0AAD5MB61_PARTN|nr:hypothetical protein KIN20_011643 [Parelaphostrongylus tenuis]